ncbi:MAG: hypothetical protein A2Y33_13735 [Spirochaetes bacterium GWF1_51_8]|nr:MAG: hypothetical protein A2Y33_13735 [Spirochaetes bacterium GWF1_51_8]
MWDNNIPIMIYPVLSNKPDCLEYVSLIATILLTGATAFLTFFLVRYTKRQTEVNEKLERIERKRFEEENKEEVILYNLEQKEVIVFSENNSIEFYYSYIINLINNSQKVLQGIKILVETKGIHNSMHTKKIYIPFMLKNEIYSFESRVYSMITLINYDQYKYLTNDTNEIEARRRTDSITLPLNEIYKEDPNIELFKEVKTEQNYYSHIKYLGEIVENKINRFLQNNENQKNNFGNQHSRIEVLHYLFIDDQEYINTLNKTETLKVEIIKNGELSSEDKFINQIEIALQPHLGQIVDSEIK